jgi:gliding motility-associated-like protein
MRKFFLFQVFVLAGLFLHAQQAGMLFGLNTENRLCKIDPNNGVVTVLSATSLTNGTVLPAPGAVDTDGERFFFIDSNNRLIVADLADGSLINSFLLSAGSNGALTYDCPDDRLYYFTDDFFHEFNPANGESRVILDFSLPTNEFLVNSMTLDEANNQFYNLRLAGSSLQLFSVGVGVNDPIDQTTPVPGNPALDHLVYACHENRFYGLEGARLRSMNPEDLTLMDVVEIQNLANVIDGTRAFNQAEGLYYVTGADNDGTTRLYTVNTVGGTFSSVPVSETLTNLAFANACTATADFEVENFCSDTPVSFINNSIADRYEWNFDDPNSGQENTSNEKDPSHQFTGPGVYTVTLRARTCTDRAFTSREIELVQPPDTLMAAVYEKCRTDRVIISAANDQVDSYRWNTGATTDTIQVEEAGFYSVEATIGDCVKTYETEVANIPCPCRPDMPNAFTPNNDQTNDTFRPVFVDDYCEVLLFSMKIFNRWGQLVYETDDTMEPWDGEHNGTPAPSDVYLWVIEFSYIDKDSGQQGELEVKKGDVALIR